MRPTYVIVIAASAGGVAALLELVQDLAPALDAAICVVLHVGSRHSVLPELLAAQAGRVRAQVLELSRLVESEPGRGGLPAPNRKVSGA